MSLKQKIDSLTNLLRVSDKINKYFITTDQITGNNFAIAEFGEAETLNVKSNFMTFKEMECYLFGMNAITNNTLTFNTVTKYARKCNITGEGMNKGYVYNDGELYFKYEADLIKHLRSSGDEEFNLASDEFILKEAYDLREYYWTSWEDDDSDWQYIEKNGVITEIEE